MQINIKQTIKPPPMIEDNVLKPIIFNPHIKMYLNWGRLNNDNKDLLLSNENLETKTDVSTKRKPKQKIEIVKMCANRPIATRGTIARVEQDFIDK